MIEEQYRKEISQIHAPKQLLEKTKQAMKEEEKRLEQQRNAKRLFSFGRVLSAAAAAVLLLSVAAVFIYSRGDKTPAQQEIPLQLSGKQEPEIGKIEKGNDTGLTVGEVSEMPEECKDIKGMMIGTETVFVIADEETGTFRAYYEKEKICYEVLSDITDEEEFIKALEEKIKALYKG